MRKPYPNRLLGARTINIAIASLLLDLRGAPQPDDLVLHTGAGECMALAWNRIQSALDPTHCLSTGLAAGSAEPDVFVFLLVSSRKVIFSSCCLLKRRYGRMANVKKKYGM